jgi:hypothetical protein
MTKALAAAMRAAVRGHRADRQSASGDAGRALHRHGPCVAPVPTRAGRRGTAAWLSGARSFMWDFIVETMKDRAVILTTHSMEECEALCSRIGILVQGALTCLGTSQHLKHRFGRCVGRRVSLRAGRGHGRGWCVRGACPCSGFQLDISTADKDLRPARDFVTRACSSSPRTLRSCPAQPRALMGSVRAETFRGATEVECFGGKLKFNIPPQDMTLATMFTCGPAAVPRLCFAR